MFGLPGIVGGIRVLFVEAQDPPIGRGFNHAEFYGLFAGNGNRGDRRLRAFLLVELDHFTNVHAIDVVCPEDRNHMGIRLLQ